MDKAAVGSFVYSFFYLMAAGFISTILPVHATELGANVAEIGPFWTVAAISSLAMTLFWGSVSDRSGKRMSHVLMGTAVLSVISILYSFAGNVYHIGAIMVLGQMLGSSQAFPIFMTFVSETSSAEMRGRSMGIFWTGGSIGWGLAESLAGAITEHWGTRAIFYLCSILFIFCLTAVRKLLWRFPLKEKAQSERGATVGEAMKSLGRFSLPFAIFWLATMCFYISDIVKMSYSLLFFEQELHLGRALATLVLSLGTWATIPSLPILGALSDRIGRKPLLLLGLFGAFLFNVLMFLSQNHFHVGLALLLYAVIWGYAVAGGAFVGDLVDEQDRAKAMSLYNSSSSMASIVAPTVMSLAILKTDFRTAFLIIAAVAVIGLLMVLFGIREPD